MFGMGLGGDMMMGGGMMMGAEMMLGAEMMGAEMMMMGGMGMGMGMCPIGCMGPCCRRIMCPPGCMGPCCINRVICPPGCMGPCCRPMMVPTNIYGPFNQNIYASNSLVPVRQVRSNQVTSRDNVTPNSRSNGVNYDIQEQIMIEKQIEKEQQRKRDKAEHLEVMKKDEELRRMRLENNKLEKEIIQQYNPKSYSGQKKEQQETNKPSSSIPKQESVGDAELASGILFQGQVYIRSGSQWQCFPNGTLTTYSFLNHPLTSISKLKVKAESQLKGTRIIKICQGNSQSFYSVRSVDQLHWMLGIIHTKLVSMGLNPSNKQEYNGVVEGEVLKRGFFSRWEKKYAVVTGRGLTVSNGRGGTVEKSIGRVDQIWSRFEVVQESWVVVKMHDFGKVEIGIPIGNILLWLRALFNLIRFL